MDKTIIGIFVGSAIVLGAIIFFATRQGGVANPGALQGDEVKVMDSRRHVAVGEQHEPYTSNPPSSGPHWPQPAPWGIYPDEQHDEQLVHNLEHGGVNVFYKPGVPKDQIKRLEDFVRPYATKVVLAPRSANDTTIALASWGRILKLDTIDDQKIKSFIAGNRNHGPEFVPDM
ncbi:DUF3105 domain-containing protein [Candidatus Berkelbacteria bacterium]|nr:DUF3105 domain-containing protein [Candidatus Berkelbacteria bacterium]